MDHFPLEGFKVVTSQEMARIEKLAYSQGASEQTFMENAGVGIAAAVEHFIESHGLPKLVTLLVGKGNNGGDAYAAGISLLKRGIKTTALSIFSFEECSPLCKKMHEKFQAAGGSVLSSDKGPIGFEGLILDGIVGTGFQGQAEGQLKKAIDAANQSALPIVSIDIPSGLNGSTGEVGTTAIRATLTLFLGLPKIGFFLKDGWNHVGELKHVDFGLKEKYVSQAEATACLYNPDVTSKLFPPIQRTRHKYQAGYVIAIAGSPDMPGAAILASFAALRAGAGIVRLFHPKGMEAELSGAPFELIREGWDGKNLKRIREETPRAKTILVGPGMGRTAHAKKRIQQILRMASLPIVVDADALYFLAHYSNWKLPQGSVLTPHHGEMQALLPRSKVAQSANDFLDLCQAFANEKETTIVLKGAPNFIFHPETLPLIVTRGDPGMATAGSGDVLTGMIAAMIAQGLNARTAACLSVYLHGYAGEIAADISTSYCLTATDLLDFLPEAFKRSLLGISFDSPKKNDFSKY